MCVLFFLLGGVSQRRGNAVTKDSNKHDLLSDIHGDGEKKKKVMKEVLNVFFYNF
jgi:hypothetical protein